MSEACPTSPSWAAGWISLPILAYPLDRAGYGRLCRLLTRGKRRIGKVGCDIAWADLQAAGNGLLLILLPDDPDERLEAELRRLKGTFGGRAISP